MTKPIENLPTAHAALVVRLAGLASVISGLVGGYVWAVDLADREDGDSLRCGFWHNPFMQFPPFDEPFLDLSMWVLFACSAAAGAGGLMLLALVRAGVPLVTWQARVSVVTNTVIACFIVPMMFIFANHQSGEWHLGGTPTALALRLGSVAVDLTLWGIVGSRAVREFFDRPAITADRAFEVIVRNQVDRLDAAWSYGRHRD